MRHLKIFVLSAALAAVACTPEQTLVNDEFKEATLTLTSEEVTIGAAEGSSVTVDIESDRSVFCVTVGYQSKTWLAASIEGKTVTITALTANPQTSERTGTISVVAGEDGVTAEKIIEVTQSAAEPVTLSISPERVEFEKEGDLTSSVTVTTNNSWRASMASEGYEWLEMTTEGNRLDFKTKSENTSLTARSVIVTITAGGVTTRL